MGSPLTDIEQQASALSPQERAELAEFLLESLQKETAIADIEMAWQAEIAERVAAYERGDAALHNAEEVFAQAKRLS